MRVIILDENNVVMDYKLVGEGCILGPNDLVSDLGVKGQIMQTDGTFITPEPVIVPQPYIPTSAEIAQMISDLQADLIIAGVI